MRVLIVEDEPELARTLAQAVEEMGVLADIAPDGERALELARQTTYEGVILDLLLPKVPGLTVLKTLREERPALPILVLTALDAIEERIEGLDLGADDYVTKPFVLAELLARLRALLRRGRITTPAAVIKAGDLEVDLRAHVVRRAGRTLHLSPREYRLLIHFVNHRGVALTRQEIGEAVIDRVFEPRSNLLEVSIHELRAKLGTPPLIHTVRGTGYRFEVEDAP